MHDKERDLEMEIRGDDGENNVADHHTDIIYGVDDVPPWYMCVFLGLQVSSTETSDQNLADYKRVEP